MAPAHARKLKDVGILVNPHKEALNRWASIVLGWSVQDIMNDRMYLNKVEPIPTTFKDLSSYYEAFKVPLLEDTRAQLQRGFEELSSASYVVVRCNIKNVKQKGHEGLSTSQKGLIKLDLGIVQLVQRRKEDLWKPKPTDVLLLCSFLPENLEDLLSKDAGHYTLALISNSNDAIGSFRANACVSTSAPVFESKRCYAMYVSSAATIRRIWVALHQGPEELHDKGKHTIPKQNLYKDNQLVKGCITSGSKGLNRKWNHLRQLMENYCISRHLNDPQKVAISTAVMNLMNSDGVQTKLLQGPPGTGKSTAITALLSIVTCLKDRILVSAPTNRAVAELAERLLRTLGTEHSVLKEIADFASAEIHGNKRHFAPLHNGDVLLVGTEDKIDTNGILGDIYLKCRVDSLAKAVAPKSGWQGSAQAVLDILRTDSGLVAYEEYEKLWEDVERPCPTFLEFIRAEMKTLGQKWINSGLVMCKHLPSKILTPKARQMLALSCEIMVELLNCLGNVHADDAQVRVWFNGTRNRERKHYFQYRGLHSAIEKLLAIMKTRPGFDVLKTGVEEACLRNAALLFCTTAMAGSPFVAGSGPFDFAVVDEAAQVVEAETTIITQLQGVNQILLVGDPNQLQAMVTSKISKSSGFDRSLFDRLQKLGHPFQILNIQYRMHPEISRFPNQRFYKGKLEDAPKVQHESYKISCQHLYGAYAFINVENGHERRGRNDKSFENSMECDIVQYILKTIQAEKKQRLSVGVISPYRGQIEKMRERMSNLAFGTLKHLAKLDVDFRTVDGFQGGERDIIIFSAVRANSAGRIGFLDDFRRLNVALTRGRYCVWIIGHAPTLSSNDPLWRALIADAKKRHCYHNARTVPNVQIESALQITNLRSGVEREMDDLTHKLQTLALELGGTNLRKKKGKQVDSNKKNWTRKKRGQISCKLAEKYKTKKNSKERESRTDRRVADSNPKQI